MVLFVNFDDLTTHCMNKHFLQAADQRLEVYELYISKTVPLLFL